MPAMLQPCQRGAGFDGIATLAAERDELIYKVILLQSPEDEANYLMFGGFGHSDTVLTTVVVLSCHIT